MESKEERKWRVGDDFTATGLVDGIARDGSLLVDFGAGMIRFIACEKPDPTAPTVEDVLKAAAEVYAEIVDCALLDCPAAVYDEDTARRAGCPCPADKTCEEDGEKCWAKTLTALTLDRARQYAAEREGADE